MIGVAPWCTRRSSTRTSTCAGCVSSPSELVEPVEETASHTTVAAPAMQTRPKANSRRSGRRWREGGAGGAAAAPPPEAPAAPKGLLLQVRVPASVLSVPALLGHTQFQVGWRSGGTSYGLGLSLLRGNVKDEYSDESYSRDRESTGTLWLLSPTVAFDVWESADRLVRAYVLLGGTMGRMTAWEESSWRDTWGGETRTDSYENEVTASVWGATAGLGGACSLHPNFAVGAEGGLAAVFLSDIEADGEKQGETASFVNGVYGTLTATLFLD